MIIKIVVYVGVALMALAFVWVLLLSGGPKPIFMWPLAVFLLGEFAVLVCLGDNEK